MMEKIGILVDSTTLTRTEISAYSFLKTVSLKVTVDGKEYGEHELSTEDMYHHLKTAKKLTTSQPAPGEFLEKYQEFYEEGYTAVFVVTLSEKISGTYQSAMIAKSMVDFPLEIQVFAPKVASFGVANGIVLIADMVQEGKSFKEVTDRAITVYENAAVMFTLSNLMHLFRGGRLGIVSALLGTVLRIKPIIEMVDGKLQLTHKTLTNQACMEYFLSAIRKVCLQFKKVYLDIIHLNRPEWAEKLRQGVLDEFPSTKIHMTDYVSPVFFVHLGNQGFGVAIVAE
jgi:DegV family protein with EDD domain